MWICQAIFDATGLVVLYVSESCMEREPLSRDIDL
jgi:hypothetical protein